MYYNIPNFDIVNNEAVIASLDSALKNFYLVMKDKFGGRKQVFPLKFAFGEKIGKITINRTTSAKYIYKQILGDVFKYFWNDRKIRYDFELTEFEEANRYYNTFTKVVFDGEQIVFIFDDSEMTSKRQKFIDGIQKFKDIYLAEVNRYNSVKENFTNYLDHYPNTEIDYSVIEEYVKFLQENSEVIHLDKYLSFYIEAKNSDSITSSRYKIENSNLFSQIKSGIEQSMKHRTDIIGVIPVVENNFSVKSFLRTDLLRFEFIYNDNFIAVKKYLDRKRGEAICAYYEEKSGGYCGD